MARVGVAEADVKTKSVKGSIALGSPVNRKRRMQDQTEEVELCDIVGQSLLLTRERWLQCQLSRVLHANMWLH